MRKQLQTIIAISSLLLACSAYAANSTYQIKSQDTLQSISQKFYGTAEFADKIYEENKSKIKNIDNLPVGQTLEIPATNDKIKRTEEGLPLLIDLESTEPPDPWCCCIDGQSPINTEDIKTPTTKKSQPSTESDNE